MAEPSSVSVIGTRTARPTREHSAYTLFHYAITYNANSFGVIERY